MTFLGVFQSLSQCRFLLQITVCKYCFLFVMTKRDHSHFLWKMAVFIIKIYLFLDSCALLIILHNLLRLRSYSCDLVLFAFGPVEVRFKGGVGEGLQPCFFQSRTFLYDSHRTNPYKLATCLFL